MPLPPFPCFTCGWPWDLQLLGKTGERRSLPAQACPSSVTAIPHGEAVFCSVPECRSRGSDVFALASPSHGHGRAFVGLGLPFCCTSDSVLFLSKIYKIPLRLPQLLFSTDIINFSVSSCLILSYFAINFSELLPGSSSSFPFTPPFSSWD